MLSKKDSPLEMSPLIRVTGVVIALHWDEKGYPLMIGIAAEDEEDYILNELEGKGAALRKWMQRRVLVSGRYKQSGQNPQTLVVEQYKLLKNPSASKEAALSTHNVL